MKLFNGFLFLLSIVALQGCISDAAVVTVGDESDSAIQADVGEPDANLPDADLPDATPEVDADLPEPQGPAGRNGEDGEDGTDGQDGNDGEDGQNGQNGTDGENGNDGQDGEDGANGINTAIQFVPAGNACPGGRGFFAVAGPDRDNNGVPDPETAVVSRPICDGAPGADGADGQDGEDGADGQDGHDGADDADGHDGADGANGPAGRIIVVSLDVATPEQCAEGGFVLVYGQDVDNDGLVDEGSLREVNLCALHEEDFPIDADNDGFVDERDCNDRDASVHPGATETCGDGIDQDCSGGDIPCIPYDDDGDGTPDAQDCAPNDPTVYPGAVEICNDQDDDCDGQIDEGLGLIAFDDFDHDGAGQPGTGESVGCRPNANLVYNNEDCDDRNASVHPGVAEVCGDGLDNDCSGGDLACQPVESVVEVTVMFPGVLEPMQLNVEPSYSYAELGRRGWTWRSPWAPGPSTHMALDSDEFEVDGLCRVRLNVTVGNPVEHRWLCEGAGPTAGIDRTATVRIRIRNRVYNESNLVPWSPDGAPDGCSMLLVLDSTGVCDRP